MKDTGIRFQFRGQEMHLHRGTYAEPRSAVALQLYSPDPDLQNALTPYMTASVNVGHADPNEVAIKDYSENEGILQAMVEAGIVSEPIRTVKSGFVEIPICRLLI
jgi:hypothetical protein